MDNFGVITSVNQKEIICIKTAQRRKLEKLFSLGSVQLGFLIISNYCTFLFYRCTNLFISENLDDGHYR